MGKNSMPKDWTDAAGWERYYASLYPAGAWTDEPGYDCSIPLRALPQIAADMKERGWNSLWIPGCGLAPLAKLFASLGLTVHATDVSPTAIAFQTSLDNDVTGLLKAADAAEVEGGALIAEVHDFRTPYLANHFDLIVNGRAFQGFPRRVMERVARVHADALRPGRQAYFDTMNVQGENRDILEAALEAGGFVVPFRELDKWYRQQLRKTRIPHLFILGHPMVPKKGSYATDDRAWELDRGVLQGVEEQYRKRRELEWPNEQKRLTPEARVATVLYSTG